MQFKKKEILLKILFRLPNPLPDDKQILKYGVHKMYSKFQN